MQKTATQPSELTFELPERMRARGIDRRQFMKLCATVTAALALPRSFIPQVAQAIATAVRVPVIWLAFQDCTGDAESFLRAAQPTAESLLLDVLSVEYHETLMVASGFQAERCLSDVMQQYAGQYICIADGAIPTGAGGAYCTIAGRSALSLAQEVCSGALATITLGACSFTGGLPAASPNPTGAIGVEEAVPGLRNLINLPGCPVNVVNLVATITHYLTFHSWPALDQYRRPLFAYGEDVHDECERHDYYEDGRFVLAWGDEGHRQGWCLYKMGCKGPRTHHNCPEVRWNGGTSWPVGAGHGCIGCTEPNFWDTLSPIYTPLPGGGDDDDDDDAVNG